MTNPSIFTLEKEQAKDVNWLRGISYGMLLFGTILALPAIVCVFIIAPMPLEFYGFLPKEQSIGKFLCASFPPVTIITLIIMAWRFDKKELHKQAILFMLLSMAVFCSVQVYVWFILGMASTAL